jgi:hypothetical protein
MPHRDRRVQRTDLTGSGASRRWHTRYLMANVFEATSGAAAAVGGLLYFLDQHSLLDASIGQGLQDLAGAWSALYFLGGVCVLLGLLLATLRLELVGLCLLGPAALTEGVSILFIAGGKGIGPGTLFTGVAVACFCRAVSTWRLAATVRVGDEGE